MENNSAMQTGAAPPFCAHIQAVKTRHAVAASEEDPLTDTARGGVLEGWIREHGHVRAQQSSKNGRQEK
jgi:hypothetical protein